MLYLLSYYDIYMKYTWYMSELYNISLFIIIYLWSVLYPCPFMMSSKHLHWVRYRVKNSGSEKYKDHKFQIEVKHRKGNVYTVPEFSKKQFFGVRLPISWFGEI